jgi:uncharacterized protein YoxC
MSEGKWWTLTERLIEQSQRLLDPNMPMTSFARLSLVSLHLLALMERKAGRDMPHSYEKLLAGNGGLVMGMMQSTLQVTPDNGPRWATDATMWILPILREWSKAGTLMPYWEMETRSELARAFAKYVSEYIRDGGLVKPGKLASFLWLLRETPALCRNVLHDVIPKGRWINFVASIAALVLRDKTCASMAPAAVLRQILSLAPYRELGLAVSENSHGFLDRLVARATTALEHREEKALLLLLLDSLKMLGGSLTSSASSSLCTFVENVLPILSPSMLRITRNVTRLDSDSSMDSAESTPPANNLSRIDVSIILPDESEEVVAKPVIYGLESCLRMSAATLLATVINVSTNKDRREFQTQTSQVLSEYVTSEDMITSAQNNCIISRGAVMRRASLLRIFAAMQDESYFVDVFVSLEACRARAFYHSSSETLRLRKRIQWLEQREKELSKENSTVEAQFHAQNASAQRERNGLHRKLVNEAKQTLTAEIAQRAELQSEVENLRDTTKELGDQLRTAETQNRTLQASEEALNKDLTEKSETLKRVEKEIHEVKQERDGDRERVARLSKDVESANVSISTYKKRDRQLRNQIVQNEEDLEGLEVSRAEMHANLESLFGDMVGLAHAYALKENEVSSVQECKEATIEKLEKDLDKERQQRKDLEDKSRQIEYANEALSHKYARAREKLEEERKQRSQAQASPASSRRGDGSKSYIQQLQLSTSRSSQRSGKENESRSMGGSSKIR